MSLLAVGGIAKGNAAAYLEAGAFSIGVGGSLVSLSEIQRENYRAVTKYAEQLMAAVNQ